MRAQYCLELIEQRITAIGEHMSELAQMQGTELPMSGESQESIRNQLARGWIMVRGTEVADLNDFNSILEVHRELPQLYEAQLEWDYKVFQQLFDVRKEQFDNQFMQRLPCPSI